MLGFQPRRRSATLLPRSKFLWNGWGNRSPYRAVTPASLTGIGGSNPSRSTIFNRRVEGPTRERRLNDSALPRVVHRDMQMKIPRWTLVTVPALAFGIGFTMNAIVMAVNGGQMPVLTPGCTPDLIGEAAPAIHSCMEQTARLTVLADWIFIRHIGAVASPGDFLEWFAEVTAAPCLIAWCALTLHKIGLIGD